MGAIVDGSRHAHDAFLMTEFGLRLTLEINKKQIFEFRKQNMNLFIDLNLEVINKIPGSGCACSQILENILQRIDATFPLFVHLFHHMNYLLIQ